ncbi:galanin-like peptide [Otolemur garnettii]|uniref:galanin-like peptide n=1 Tax=Otolemur garnettii TaxID=30611 RepID=UPI00064452FF|nr:galanin-like peptide [Otolemur garnettii]
MAPSLHLVLLLSILLSLVETPASAPAHQGQGGWTLNSAGYLLGPALHLSLADKQDRRKEAALEILDLWRVLNGLPYSRSQRAPKKSLVETFAKPENRGLGMLGE